MTHRILQLLVAAAVVAVPSLASANDVSTGYPGTRCKYYGVQGGDGQFHLSGQQANGIKNLGATAYLVCPIIREVMNEARVVFAYANVSGGVTCGLYQRSADASNTIHIDDPSSTTTSSNGAQHLVYGNGGGLISDGSYAFYCRVPTNGVVLGYGFSENAY